MVLFTLFLVGLCTLAQSQPPSCSNGMVYNSCGLTECRVTCANYAIRHLIPCPEICGEGCFCPEGLVEHNDGCVAPEDCPRSNCSNGKVYNSCGTLCPVTCANYAIQHLVGACPAVCVEGCFCPEGLVQHNELCLVPEECPNITIDACSTTFCQEHYNCRVNDNGDAECVPDCESNNGGCREDQLCNVFLIDNHPGYINCVDPPYVLCGSDAFLACDSEFLYCLQQNKTREANCIASCLSDNGGCLADQVCITNIMDDESTTLQCRRKSSLSTECPAGQLFTKCGGCQTTCELYLTGEMFACAAVCRVGCQCPNGLLLYRDRCVDRRLCHVLVNYPPPIDPLPIVQANLYLYSLLSPTSSLSDFEERGFIAAVREILSGENFPAVTVGLHGVYEDDGLLIVIHVSGDGLDGNMAVQLRLVLQENTDQLPLPVNQVEVVDVDRVDGYWTVQRIVGLSLGLVSALLLLIVLVVGVVVSVLYRNKSNRNKNKVRVESHNLVSNEKSIGDKERLEFES